MPAPPRNGVWSTEPSRTPSWTPQWRTCSSARPEAAGPARRWASSLSTRSSTGPRLTPMPLRWRRWPRLRSSPVPRKAWPPSWTSATQPGRTETLVSGIQCWNTVTHSQALVQQEQGIGCQRLCVAQLTVAHHLVESCSGEPCGVHVLLGVLPLGPPGDQVGGEEDSTTLGGHPRCHVQHPEQP